MIGDKSMAKDNRRSVPWTWGAGLLLVVSAGAAYGHYTHRWGPPRDLTAAASHLKTLPKTIGDWQLQEESEIGPGVIQMLQCAGYVNRAYVNVKSGESVSMALIVGPPGPIAVHTPEICYSSRNYTLIGGREVGRVADQAKQSHTYWKTTFESKSVFAERLRVCYAWSDGVRWNASTSPRFEYAASPLLFKMQIAGLAGAKDEAIDKTPPAMFLKALLDSGWQLSPGDGNRPAA
ncbi:MAG: hypothetical protein DCC67_20190 [Planctomycetota bacterium]|nr:MAG: hypothetical protein DCC67_20190 [Planctomycetota bacterium]